MRSLTWRRWTCPACGASVATLIDTSVTCTCGATSRVDKDAPLATEDEVLDRSCDQ